MTEQKSKVRLTDVKRAASITGYRPETLRRLIRQGKIKAVKPNGGKFLIFETSLVDFLKGENTED